MFDRNFLRTFALLLALLLPASAHASSAGGAINTDASKLTTGTLNPARMAPASPTTLGGVKCGAGTACAGDGTLSVTVTGGGGGSSPATVGYLTYGAPEHQWSGITIIGDAASYNGTVTPLSGGWGQLVADQMGVGPTYKVNPQLSPSIFQCDVVDTKVALMQAPNASSNLISAWLPSVNDPGFGAGVYANHLADNLTCTLAGLTWLTVPATYRVYAQSSGFAFTGSWANSAAYGGTFGMTSSTNGDTGAGTITTNGGPIYLWYLMRGNNGGTFTYNLDGGATLGTVATQGNNAFTFPMSTSKQTLGAVPIPVASPGSHTVNVALTSTTTAGNTVTIIGIGTPPNKAFTSKSPLVVQGGQVWIDNTYASVAAIFNAAYQTQAAQLLADGLGVIFADVQNRFNFSTDVMAYFNGGTYLNARAQKHIADAYTGIVQPLRSADGSIDPRDYGAACNTSFYGYIQNGGGTDPYWHVNATAGSPVISIASNGNAPYYFQPGTATQFGGGDVGKRICLFGGDNGDAGPCTYILSVNTSNNTATLGANVPVTLSSGAGRSAMFGGYPTNPSDPSTATDDTPYLEAASQAAILGGGKVHLPNRCMGHMVRAVANVTWEGNNAGHHYHAGEINSINTDSTPAVPTIFYCGNSGTVSSDPVCIDASIAPQARFKNFLVAGMTFPYLPYGFLTEVGIGYGRTSGSLGANGKTFTDDMSYFLLPVGVGQAFGYNSRTDFTGALSGTTLTVSGITSTRMQSTYGTPASDYLGVGMVITGAGVPANETILAAAPRGGAGAYTVSIAATTTSEAMNTVLSATIMSLVDNNSQYGDWMGIGINGDFTDSHIFNDIFSGTFMGYGWYYGPYSGNNAGNGGSSIIGGRFEEQSSAGLVCDSCLVYVDGVDFDFNGGYNIIAKGFNSNPLFGPNVQVNGGWMIGGGHCNAAAQDKAMISVGGNWASVSVDGVMLGTNDLGSGCSGTTTYLFSTATGGSTSQMNLSVMGGNSSNNAEGKITNLYNWSNGTPLHYKQDVMGWPKIDTSVSLSATSSGFTIGAFTGGALYATTSATSTSATGAITLTLPAVTSSWNCRGDDQTAHSPFALGPTTSTSAALYATSTVNSGDFLSVSCPNGL